MKRHTNAKRFLSVFLCVLMLAALVPATGVSAATATNRGRRIAFNVGFLPAGVWVNGVQMTSGQTIKCGDGTATLDTTTTPYTLSLVNATIDTWKSVQYKATSQVSGKQYFSHSISSDKDLKIVFKGTTNIVQHNDNYACGIYAPNVAFFGDPGAILNIDVSCEMKTTYDAAKDWHFPLDIAHDRGQTDYAVGIRAVHSEFHGGTYNVKATDNLNDLSLGIFSSEPMVFSGKLNVFGSDSAFNYVIGCESDNTVLREFRTGSSATSNSPATFRNSVRKGSSLVASPWIDPDMNFMIHDENFVPFVTLTATRTVGTAGVVGTTVPVQGETAGSLLKTLLPTSPLLSIQSAAWYDVTSVETKMTSSQKFTSGRKYRLDVFLIENEANVLSSSTAAGEGFDASRSAFLSSAPYNRFRLRTADTYTERDVDYGIAVNGTYLTKAHPSAACGDGYAYYDTVRETLVLENATITTPLTVSQSNGTVNYYRDYGIYAASGKTLFIEVNGVNTIAIPDKNPATYKTTSVYGIYVHNDDIQFVYGHGTLNILNEKSYANAVGIEASGFSNTGTTLRITSGEGLRADSYFNGGRVEIDAGTTGYYSEGSEFTNDRGAVTYVIAPTPLRITHFSTGDFSNPGLNKIYGLSATDGGFPLTDTDFDYLHPVAVDGKGNFTDTISNAEAQVLYLGPGKTPTGRLTVDLPVVGRPLAAPVIVTSGDTRVDNISKVEDVHWIGTKDQRVGDDALRTGYYYLQVKVYPAAGFRYEYNSPFTVNGSEAQITELATDGSWAILRAEIGEAGTEYANLIVNGEYFSADKLTIPCGSGTASYDPAQNTLTLTDATVTKATSVSWFDDSAMEQHDATAAIAMFEGMTLKLVGKNVIDITAGDEGDPMTGIWCVRDWLTVEGSGSLEFKDSKGRADTDEHLFAIDSAKFSINAASLTAAATVRAAEIRLLTGSVTVISHTTDKALIYSKFYLGPQENYEVKVGTSAPDRALRAGDSLSDFAAVSCIYHVPFMYGDVNGDGKINTMDLTVLRAYLANLNPETGTSPVTVSAGADCNGDGKISTLDLTLLRSFLAYFNPETGESAVVLGPKN